ncbi:MAG TPA: tetratricopeptide repeat protein [Candidatus Desulfaltia sp.]|nr:tetratricopeptide repeat protein [Candidatus Desulfaltia sp.]
MKNNTVKSIGVISCIAILGALVSVAGIARQAEEPGVLLRAAIEKEEVDGDLQGAIDVYKQIIAKHSDNRPIAAKALLRLGGCYEKLGLREAQSAYQRVIEDYPQQLEEVKAAKERIARLARASAETPGKPQFRKIQIPANPGNGVLSPDGKRLAFATEGTIWVVPIPGNVDPNIAGTPVRLTEPVGANNVENSLAWSGDGKWIAFNTSWSDSLADPNSIFIVSSTGGPVKKMPIQPEGDPSQRRLSLSPDGKTLIFRHGRGIYTLSVDTGEGKVLTEAKWGDPAFSPDGARLAFVNYVRTGTEDKFSVWVADLGGNAPVKISEMSGFMRGPTWSPDGSMIAFIHDPSTRQVNDRKVCIIPVGDPAAASNNPLVIELPLEPDAVPAGWTSQNSIGVMLRNPPFAAIYTVPSSGGRATQVSPAGQTVTHPRWSPDGRRIFYRGLGIFSIPWDGGAVATVLAHANRGELYEATSGGGNNVSPDGKKLVFSGAINIPKRGDPPSHIEVNIYTIPVEGGQPAQITAFPWDPKNPWAGQARFPCWSPDGKTIAFIRDHTNEKDNHVIDIFTVSSSGGAPQQITSESDRVAWAGIDWSPDGRHIAYFSQDKTVSLFPMEGGASKTLIKVEDIGGHSELSWSPDGKEIAFSDMGKIYTVLVEGGQPVEVKTGLEAEASNLAWSPDGKTIAFAATKSEPAELYLMEDFLKPGK